jgi:type I restriction enzyme S subunit
MWSLRPEHFKMIYGCVPPLPEQSAIVRFLDYVERRVRLYVRAKQKLIKLLEEQKQAIIHRAVTRGLDPDAHLKPSGVEWLGEVPEHWEMLDVRRCAKTVKTGGTPTGVGDEHFSTQGFNWYTPGDFKDDLYLRTSKRQLSEIGKENVKLFPPNTVMMIGIGATIGKVAISMGHASCNQQINGIVLNNRMDVAYFSLSLRSLREYIVSCGKFTTLPIINQDETKSLPIPVPPISEQRKIVEYILSQVATIDQAIDFTRCEIELLREYRTRLITDVVTGKLDVREAAAKLPDEADEPEPLDEVDNLIDESAISEEVEA